MKSKTFWYSLMAGSLVGWLFVLAGAAAALGAFPLAGFPFPDHPILGTLWIALCVIWASHPLELPIASWRLAKERGLSPARVVLKTLAFGFTWWLPLKKGILDC